MLLLLLATAFVLHFLLFERDNLNDCRLAALFAALALGIYVVIITELLSLFHAISRVGDGISWAVICLAAAAILWHRRFADTIAKPKDELNGTADTQTTLWLRWLFAGVGLLIVIVVITAFVAPPNVWDAMEYHLPRVSMWMSNHSVEFYPTPDYAQLIFAPWAEFAMMQTYLLQGSDRFVNLVEVLSFLGCMIAGSYAAKLLGAGRWGQILAAVITVTITEGVLEASGPMNTYVVSFWILSTVIFLMRFNHDPSWTNAVLVGCAAGLAVLTKGTAYVYLPFVVLACWLMGNARARVEFWKKSPVFLFFVLALNGMFFWRCYQLTGSPLGMPFPDGGPRLHWAASVFGPRALVVNVIRNVTFHIVTPVAGVNLHIEKAVRALIHCIGADPDDPRAVWTGYRFALNHFSVHEIHAGNPLHFLLVLICAALLLTNYRKLGSRREVFILSAGLLASFLFFSGLLRWQIWGSRHQLPLFVLASVICGVLLEKAVSRQTGLAVASLLLVYALLFSVVNRTRSLVKWDRVDDVYQGRAVQYFADQHEDQASNDIALADAINRLPCRDLGFDAYTGLPAAQLNSNTHPFFIYPLFALTHVDGRIRTAQYLGVDNLSVKFERASSRRVPCAVICLDCTRAKAKLNAYRGRGGEGRVFGTDVLFSYE
jgi:hypothetical protein